MATRFSSRCCSSPARGGCRIAEVPITFVERREGESKVSRAVLIESAITPWRLIANRTRAARRAARRILTRCSCYGLGPFHMSDARRIEASGPERLLPGLQRQRHHRQHGDPRGAGRGSADAGLRSDRRQRRQRRRDRRDRRRTGAHLSARPRHPPPEKPRLWRRAADRIPIRDQGSDLLYRRRRAVRPGGNGRPVGEHDRRRRHGERLQDQPVGSAAPHHHRPALSPHRLR